MLGLQSGTTSIELINVLQKGVSLVSLVNISLILFYWFHFRQIVYIYNNLAEQYLRKTKSNKNYTEEITAVVHLIKNNILHRLQTSITGYKRDVTQ